MNARLKRRLIIYFILLCGGTAYYFICAASYALPCPINAVTGLLCPGCGITRMLLACIRGDFAKMFSYNLVLPFILPLIGALVALSEYRYIRYGKSDFTKAETVICVIAAVILIAYGIARNIIPSI